MRVEVAKSLGQLGDRDGAILLLLELFGNEELETWQQCNAAQGLVKFGYTDDALFDFIFRLVRNKQADYYLRTEGAKVLGELGRFDYDVIRNLFILAHDKEMESYGLQDTLEAIAKLGKKNTAAMSVLLQLAMDKNEGIRYGTFQVLKKNVGNLRYKEIEKYKIKQTQSNKRKI